MWAGATATKVAYADFRRRILARATGGGWGENFLRAKIFAPAQAKSAKKFDKTLKKV